MNSEFPYSTMLTGCLFLAYYSDFLNIDMRYFFFSDIIFLIDDFPFENCFTSLHMFWYIVFLFSVFHQDFLIPFDFFFDPWVI